MVNIDKAMAFECLYLADTATAAAITAFQNVELLPSRVDSVQRSAQLVMNRLSRMVGQCAMDGETGPDVVHRLADDKPRFGIVDVPTLRRMQGAQA